MFVRRGTRIGFGLKITILVALALLVTTTVFAAPPLSGAIFTTTVDGGIVNENVHYEAKEDVYLDGGPGPNAPASAAGLPEGDYYFQVTDPSGKDLLSTDHISCRRIHVNSNGVIDHVYAGQNWEKQQGEWTQVPCQHAQGVDIDHAELGAITVQLYPYDDTPNPGGVYKAWITPVEDYIGSSDCVEGEKGKCNINGENWEPNNVHGFVPAASKTDNYKVKKKGKPFTPPEITVRKFHDANANGVWDEGEEEVTGWLVDYTDPIGTGSVLYTPETVLAAEAGDYTFVEETPAGTQQTAAYLDGAALAVDPTVVVAVAGESEETHEVIYGNVGLGNVAACKVYDRDGDGVADDGEPGVEGWQMELTGTDATGAAVGPLTQFTGADGCTTFGGLLPGTYTVTEIFPAGGGWTATSATSQEVTIVSTLSGAEMSGGTHTVTFTNFCEGVADFGTKGYWHNKNGLAEITQADIDYVNGLAPYAAPSSYFTYDEPFDGLYDGGLLVPAAYNNEDVAPIAAEGTAWAEISHFLVDSNADGDPREQLAQQLLAFIFNARHRLDDQNASILLPDGTWVSAQSLIDEAIAAWLSNDADWQNNIKNTLDALNNSDALPFIHYFPCAVNY